MSAILMPYSVIIDLYWKAKSSDPCKLYVSAFYFKVRSSIVHIRCFMCFSVLAYLLVNFGNERIINVTTTLT